VATFNTNCAANWQTIDLSTMTFPAEMRIDYVRVYQREGNENVGCDPPDYPTTEYINKHPVAYSSLSCSQRGISFMRADSVASCRSAVAILDVWSCWRKLYGPQELASASDNFCSRLHPNMAFE
jgi:Beta-glucan synthesis-associated protein SKN1/KRE6/Sbg1